MNSTTTLRSDVARTGANPNFPITSDPWRKYVSIDLTNSAIPYQARPVRAGVLVLHDWNFNTGFHQNETHTLLLVATTTNELFCYSEADLLQNGSSGKPLWYTSLASSAFPPRTRPGSNMATPIGICGTPVADIPNRRMFVIAMWETGPQEGAGNYSIFEISLDTGHILQSQKLVDTGAAGRITFNPDVVDQRTAINLVGQWLWVGFAAYLAWDDGNYSGWVVAISSNNLAYQLYQPMIDYNHWNDPTVNLRCGGVWGVGGVAAAQDQTVYALTGNGCAGPNGNDILPQSFWSSNPTGPGTSGSYFQALVRIGPTRGAEIAVVDWFQDSTIVQPDNISVTQYENNRDWDFGGSTPLLLPPVNGQNLIAFVPKDGNIFILNAQNLGKFSAGKPVSFADIAVNHGNDTKTALAFFQTADKKNILVVAADSHTTSTGNVGGLAAFQIDASANPPVLTRLWTSPHYLNDSFGSPTLIANPIPDASKPPTPAGLVWVIDGSGGLPGSFSTNCTMRAYDLVSGSVAYDSGTKVEVTETIPNFAAITSGGNSVFCPTISGFMGFTQFSGWSGTGGWNPIGGFFPPGCPITSVTRMPGQLDLFVIGNDGVVYTSWWTEGHLWSGVNGWRNIGGPFPPGARVAAVARTPNNLDLFVCGNDGRVYTSWWTSTSDWSGLNNKWRALGGFFPKGNQVTVVSRTPNNLDLFIVGGDGAVYTSWWTNIADWSGINNNWRNLGGTGTFPSTTRVAAVARTPNNLDLFICGSDGYVYTSWWSNTADWSGIGKPWANLGGKFPPGAMVTAVSRQAQQIDLFIVSNQVYTSWWNNVTGWSGLNGWESLGGFFNPNTEVSVIKRSPGNLDLFACGNDGHVYTSWWSEGNQWSSSKTPNWLDIGGTFPANVHVDGVGRSTGNMDLFICGGDGKVYTSWWNATAL